MSAYPEDCGCSVLLLTSKLNSDITERTAPENLGRRTPPTLHKKMTVRYLSDYLRRHLEALTSVTRSRELPYLCGTECTAGVNWERSVLWGATREVQGPFLCPALFDTQKDGRRRRPLIRHRRVIPYTPKCLSVGLLYSFPLDRCL